MLRDDLGTNVPTAIANKTNWNDLSGACMSTMIDTVFPTF